MKFCNDSFASGNGTDLSPLSIALNVRSNAVPHQTVLSSNITRPA